MTDAVRNTAPLRKLQYRWCYVSERQHSYFLCPAVTSSGLDGHRWTRWTTFQCSFCVSPQIAELFVQYMPETFVSGQNMLPPWFDPPLACRKKNDCDRSSFSCRQILKDAPRRRAVHTLPVPRHSPVPLHLQAAQPRGSVSKVTSAASSGLHRWAHYPYFSTLYLCTSTLSHFCLNELPRNYCGSLP